jgi:DNA-binding HxlR family transcriptional regulator
MVSPATASPPPARPAKRKRYDCAPGCPVEATLDLIDGKWKGVILFHLLDDTLRFNALRRRLNGITQRMLIKQLRELEASGLVQRTVYAQVPPRVDYALTETGKSMQPVLLALHSWGTRWMEEIGMVPPETVDHQATETRVAESNAVGRHATDSAAGKERSSGATVSQDGDSGELSARAPGDRERRDGA